MMQITEWAEGPAGIYYDAIAQYPKSPGGFKLTLTARPAYCDRGNWLMDVSPFGSARDYRVIDEQDGFPRYFFGTLEEAKEQFRKWVEKRKDTPC